MEASIQNNWIEAVVGGAAKQSSETVQKNEDRRSPLTDLEQLGQKLLPFPREQSHRVSSTSGIEDQTRQSHRSGRKSLHRTLANLTYINIAAESPSVSIGGNFANVCRTSTFGKGATMFWLDDPSEWTWSS